MGSAAKRSGETMLSKKQIKEITNKVSNYTKRKYCSQCRSEQPVDGGKMVKVNSKVSRYFCKKCLTKKRERDAKRI